MKKVFHSLFKVFRWFWRLVNGLSTLLVASFIFLILLSMAGILVKSPPQIPRGSALLLMPSGEIVERRTSLDPLTAFFNELQPTNLPEETLLQDLLDVIAKASEDTRIKLMVIDPSHMEQVGLDQLLSLGDAVEQFKQSGKVVIAVSDSFNQSQYLLASHADEIYLNPMGNVGLRGFGLYRLYARKLLEKLGVNFHVFQVGAYKSALEPFIRDNMSPNAREANELWLGKLWGLYRDSISKRRGFRPEFIDEHINSIADNLRESRGDSARMALDAGLVDGLKSMPEFKEYLIGLVGASDDKSTFRHISSQQYAKTITPTYSGKMQLDDRIGIIVAQGDIVFGSKVPGMIDSLSISELINEAGIDPMVKALVLRIDSGGGSAFASEMIRQELLQVQKNGKPVVVSMGSMAASGAYWLAADADAIIASPATLTGSIGIFGAFPTFEKTLAKHGVFSDGVGTTNMADSGAPFRPLSDEYKKAVQLEVENGYDRFLEIVANGRNLSRAQVEKLAEGRVWDGATAATVGLVDQLGDLEDAIRVAADLAGLTDYEAGYIETGLSPMQELLREIKGQAAMALTSGSSGMEHVTERLMDFAGKQLGFLLTKDPAGVYAHSLIPHSFLLPTAR